MMCKNIADKSDMLHEILAGYNQAFGIQLGPTRIIIPKENKYE